MKILSWNTFLAPTMPNRFVRERHVVNQTVKWIKEGVDVILLQEMNNYTIGLMGWVYYKINVYKWLNSTTQRFMDYVLYTEGFIFPFFTYDHTKLLKESIDKFNSTKKSPQYSIINSSQPYRGLSGGLVIISKYALFDNFTINLPSDLIHAPSILGGFYKSDKGVNMAILNSHLIPKLPNYTCTYVLVNILNYLCRINTRKLQLEGIDILYEIITPFRKVTDNIYIGGDFNIGKTQSPKMYRHLTHKLCLLDSGGIDFINTQHHINCADGERGHGEDQIDYIMSPNNPINKCKRIEGTIYLSDHHPILTEYDV
jgi:hypothetical protein